MASARHAPRPGSNRLPEGDPAGNTLVLWNLDLLGRDLRHLADTVEELDTRGVGLKAGTGAWRADRYVHQ